MQRKDIKFVNLSQSWSTFTILVWRDEKKQDKKVKAGLASDWLTQGLWAFVFFLQLFAFLFDLFFLFSTLHRFNGLPFCQQNTFELFDIKLFSLANKAIASLTLKYFRRLGYRSPCSSFCFLIFNLI